VNRSSSTQYKRSKSQSPGFEIKEKKIKKNNKKSEKSIDIKRDEPVEEEPEMPKFEIIRPELPKLSKK
jgi:hypothetical protein